MHFLGGSGEFLGVLPARPSYTESVSDEESIDQELQSWESNSDDDDRVIMEGLWDSLGLWELPNAEIARDNDSGASWGLVHGT